MPKSKPPSKSKSRPKLDRAFTLNLPAAVLAELYDVADRRLMPAAAFARGAILRELERVRRGDE